MANQNYNDANFDSKEDVARAIKILMSNPDSKNFFESFLMSEEREKDAKIKTPQGQNKNHKRL